MEQWISAILVAASTSLAVWAAETSGRAANSLGNLETAMMAVGERLDGLEDAGGYGADSVSGKPIARLIDREKSSGNDDLERLEASLDRVRSALNEVDVRLALLDAQTKVSVMPVQLGLTEDVKDLRGRLDDIEATLVSVSERTNNITGGETNGRKWMTVAFGDAQARFRPDGVFAIYDRKNRRRSISRIGR